MKVGRLLAAIPRTRCSHHLWHRLQKQEELDAYIKQIEEGVARPSPARLRDEPLPFPEEAPGSVFWQFARLTLFQQLENISAAASRSRLCRSKLTTAHGQGATVTTGHPDLQRFDTLTAKREDDERVYAIKPMNCPGHVQIFKNGSSRTATCRSQSPSRQMLEPQVHCMAGCARAFHPGRRATSSSRKADRRRGLEGQQPDPMRIWLRRRPHQIL